MSRTKQRNYSVSEELKAKASNLAKINVLRNFYAVGILEQFVDTLKSFEAILPNYYSGVLDIWNSQSKSLTPEQVVTLIVFLSAPRKAKQNEDAESQGAFKPQPRVFDEGAAQVGDRSVHFRPRTL